MKKQPNILFVFADQWRAQAFGYAGDPNVKTPHIDRFAQQSVNFDNAVSGCPVCTPYRASLMTGVYPNRHKLMVNDQCLAERYDGPFLAECLNEGGYQTAYIGKWHIDGKGRNTFVPAERRLGFSWWKGFECTHDYQDSYYYFGNDPRPHKWEGYDADAQTDEACRFLREEVGEQPFALFLSWGPPHNPFGTAPAKFEAMYDPATIELSPNVPDDAAETARKELAGYYAHCSALDAAFGRLVDALEATGRDKDTIVIFTSDHGDMLGSQGMSRKQKPWAESLRVPFLVRHPQVAEARTHHTPIDAPDMMPTLLSLCGAPIPEAVQGRDFSATIVDGTPSGIDHALLALYLPFHEWRYNNGGRELRGLHNEHYTYVRTLEGPWLLYDNLTDPAQLANLVADPAYADETKLMDAELSRRLQTVGDDFVPGPEIIKREGYAQHPNGAIAIMPSNLPKPHED
ncbi:MAG: sulfatase [Verrucomicrobia bacterium]|jgi:arylsulfatase A-like enzyme|nr:sulfatase [Verrucomicrobiota bacterium]MBT7066221.1 sulfatase [Verrucomicrobiota bacterium]MBT7699698.1 sulfatase [Verrucomicrobiota bacterium]